MKKLLLSLSCFLLITVSALSQKRGDILKDDPENMKVFKVRLPCLMTQPADANFAFYVANTGIDWFAKDKFYISSTFNLLMGEAFLTDSNSEVAYSTASFLKSKEDKGWSRYFHIEGTYFFKGRVVTKRIETSSSTYNNAANTMKAGDMNTAKVLKKVGIRFGFRKGFQMYRLHGGGSFDSNIKFVSGDQSTYLNYSQLRIGIGRAKTANIFIRTNNDNDGGRSWMKYIYADFVYAIAHELEDVYYFTKNPHDLGNSYSNAKNMFYSSRNIDKYSEKQKMGVEVGLRMIPARGIFGYQIQAGTVTGIKGTISSYVEIGLTWQFGTREKL